MKSWFKKVKEHGFFSSFSNDTKQDVDELIGKIGSPSSSGDSSNNRNNELAQIKNYETVEETIQAELEQWLSSFDNGRDRTCQKITSTTPAEEAVIEEPFTPTTPITPMSALSFAIAKQHVKINMALVFFNAEAKSIIMELNGCMFEIHYTDSYSPVSKNELVSIVQ